MWSWLHHLKIPVLDEQELNILMRTMYMDEQGEQAFKWAELERVMIQNWIYNLSQIKTKQKSQIEVYISNNRSYDELVSNVDDEKQTISDLWNRVQCHTQINEYLDTSRNTS